jgi:perosamine synthetase
VTRDVPAGAVAAGVRPGNEVITVSHSYIATCNAIRYGGATPVFVDIEPKTFNLGPSRIPSAIGEPTRAGLCVHQLGIPCDMAEILKIAETHGIPVVEDAACAIGSEILSNNRWERIGKPDGAVACFSFHPRRLLTTGDGAMLTTRNPEFDRRFRLWRQHGMGVPDTVRHGAKEGIFESYLVVGYNYRMTDIQAAIRREQIKRLDELLDRGRSLAGRYDALLDGVAGVHPPTQPPWARSNFQSYCIRLDDGLDQRAVMQVMLDLGVATRRGVMCAHREDAYPPGTWRCAPRSDAHAPCDAAEALRYSESAQDHCIILPLYHDMTDSDQDAVVHSLARALAHVRRSAECPGGNNPRWRTQ